MPDLDQNIEAHKETWALLLATGQNFATFDVSGEITVSNFPKWVQGQSNTQRQSESRSLAIHFDTVLRSWHAEYESAEGDVNARSAKAVEALTSLLSSDSTTIFDLAQKIDEIYRFPEEKKSPDTNLDPSNW